MCAGWAEVPRRVSTIRGPPGKRHRRIVRMPSTVHAQMNEARLVADFVQSRNRLMVLTGAGCGTASGIPDYRGSGGTWFRVKPIYFSDFTRSESVRKRYWARSFRGWPRFSAARPNPAHAALVEMERTNRTHFLLTQNVDGLHEKAGSNVFLELHGRSSVVICMQCVHRFPRDEMQRRLSDANGPLLLETIAHVSVAKNRLEDSDSLLVIGSSLQVWSGYRFARLAAEQSIPIALLNMGVTRADDLAALKVHGDCSVILPQVARLLRGKRSTKGTPLALLSNLFSAARTDKEGYATPLEAYRTAWKGHIEVAEFQKNSFCL